MGAAKRKVESSEILPNHSVVYAARLQNGIERSTQYMYHPKHLLLKLYQIGQV